MLIGKGDNVRLQFEARDTLAYPISMHVLANRWWHIACVFQAHQDMKMYLNGVMVAQKPTNLDMQPSPLPLFIGTSPWDSFDGEIADVRLWDVARSQDQILASMHQTISPSSPNLIANWTFRTLSRGRSYDLTHHTKPAQILGNPTKTRLPAQI